jgi:hypothetical protein
VERMVQTKIVDIRMKPVELKLDTSKAGVAEEDEKVKAMIREIYTEFRKVWDVLLKYIKSRKEELSRQGSSSISAP